MLILLGSVVWAQPSDVDLADAKIERGVLHFPKSLVIDEFIRQTNAFYKLVGERKITSEEFINALRFHQREMTFLQDKQIKILSDVVKSGKVPPGTEVDILTSIKFSHSTVAIKSDVIRVVFGKKGLFNDGVSLKPNEEQGKNIFSLYVRFILLKEDVVYKGTGE